MTPLGGGIQNKSEIPYPANANLMKIQVDSSKQQQNSEEEFPRVISRKFKESLEISKQKQKQRSGKEKKSSIPPSVESIPRHVRELYSPLGDFEWHELQSDDDIGDYFIILDRPVTRIRRSDLKAFFAERKERNELRKQKGLEPKKPTKGHWFCVYDPEYDRDEPCTMCLKKGHSISSCPFRRYVPKDAKLGPGGAMICKCCREEDAHRGTDWIACATDSICMNCRNIGEHETEECPNLLI